MPINKFFPSCEKSCVAAMEGLFCIGLCLPLWRALLFYPPLLEVFMKQFAKTIPLFSLVFVLFFATCMLVGCNKDNQSTTTYTVTFMRASYIIDTGDDISYNYLTNKQISVEENSVIGSISINTKYGTGKLYQFAGWFTEEECINQWDLYRDEVRSNLTLYPKYVRIQ